MKILPLFMVAIIASMAIISYAPLRSYAVSCAGAVQCNFATNTGVNSLAVTFVTTPTVGDIIVVVLSSYSAVSSGVSSASVTDNQSPHNTYTQVIRATDQGNGEYSGIFSAPITTSSGTFIVTASASTVGGYTQSMVMGIYELNGVSDTPYNTTSQEGGGNSFTIGSSGQVIISSVVSHSAGGTWACTCNSRQTLSINQAVGDGPGVWNGITSVTYSEEADAGFGAPLTTTTETAMNACNGTTCTNGVIFMIVLLLPWALVTMILERFKARQGYVFFSIFGLLLGSIISTLAHALPYFTIFVFGSIAGVYLWRGRRSSGSLMPENV